MSLTAEGHQQIGSGSSFECKSAVKHAYRTHRLLSARDSVFFFFFFREGGNELEIITGAAVAVMAGNAIGQGETVQRLFEL